MHDGGGVLEYERRHDLEMALEKAAATEGSVYLGHLHRGEWQINSRLVGEALSHVLTKLVEGGLVKSVPQKLSGKATVCWLAANRYVKGEAFPKAPKARKAKEEDEEEEEEQLADIELERLRNIERNKEILRSLGLA